MGSWANLLCKEMALLHDTVTWYKITQAGTQHAQWDSYQSTLTWLCFGSATVQLASQLVWFCTMWPDHAKGPFPWKASWPRSPSLGACSSHTEPMQEPYHYGLLVGFNISGKKTEVIALNTTNRPAQVENEDLQINSSRKEIFRQGKRSIACELL